MRAMAARRRRRTARHDRRRRPSGHPGAQTAAAAAGSLVRGKARRPESSLPVTSAPGDEDDTRALALARSTLDGPGGECHDRHGVSRWRGSRAIVIVFYCPAYSVRVFGHVSLPVRRRPCRRWSSRRSETIKGVATGEGSCLPPHPAPCSEPTFTIDGNKI